MTTAKPFHWLYSLRFLRKTLLVYLIPLLPVIVSLDLSALLRALEQDFVLFLVLASVSRLIARSSSWQLDAQGVLHLRWGFWFHIDCPVQKDTVVALTLERTLLYRLVGACRVTLYSRIPTERYPFTLWLSREDAEWLAERILPSRLRTVYRPEGKQKIAFSLLSTDNKTSLLLLVLFLRQTDRYGLATGSQSLEYLNRLASRMSHRLPVSVVWVLTVLVLFLLYSLLRGIFGTLSYHVWKTEEVLGCHRGFFTLTDLRIRRDGITAADLRLSLTARLLRYYPLYLTAGGLCKTEIPFLVFDPLSPSLLDEFLPEFVFPPPRAVDTTGRSLLFLAPSGGGLAFFLLLTVLSSRILPELTPLLFFPDAYFLVMLLCALVGFRDEGAWSYGGRLTLRRQQKFVMHNICVFSPDVVVRLSQSPWAVKAGRANLEVFLPARFRWQVRSIPIGDARACMENPKLYRN